MPTPPPSEPSRNDIVGGTDDDLALAEMRLRFALLTASPVDLRKLPPVESLMICRFAFRDHFVMHASFEHVPAMPKPYLHVSAEMVDQRFTLEAQTAAAWNEFIAQHLAALELARRPATSFRVIKAPCGRTAKLHLYFYDWTPTAFTLRLRNLPTQPM